MTKKLFLNDSYTKTFEGRVVDSYPIKDNTAVILEETYFYPEGGGQPADQGWINNQRVLDVYYYEENIIHLVEGTLNKEQVQCEIDWNRRLTLMQQHLGQHVLSRAFEKLFDANTVGFHIGSGYVTIDIDKHLDEEDFLKVEKLSNKIVFENREVKVLYPTPEALKQLPLRKPPTVSENVRIVVIENFDYSPCGGTHLNQTGEIGLIKIKKVKNQGDTQRVEFVCGQWALEDYQFKNTLVNDLGLLLTSQDMDIYDRVEQLNEEFIAIKKERDALKNRLLEMESAQLANEYEVRECKKVVAKKIPNKGIKELRYMTNDLIEKEDYLVCLIGLEGEQVNLVLGKSKNLGDPIKTIFKDYINRLEGNGGGSPFLCQGSGKKYQKIDEIIKDFINLN